MISWIVIIVIMLLFWHYQKLSQLPTRPGGQNIVRYFDPPTRYFAFNVCISYLLDKIYHYIKIILMISLVIIMLLFWYYQKLSQLKVKHCTTFWLTPLKQSMTKFCLWLIFIRSINILTSWMISCLSGANAFNFCTTKNYPNLTRGSKYHTRGSKYRIIFWPPPPPPPPPQPLIINYKVFYLPAFHIYSRRCIIISKSY